MKNEDLWKSLRSVIIYSSGKWYFIPRKAMENQAKAAVSLDSRLLTKGFSYGES
jgi:hypothetical protein